MDLGISYEMVGDGESIIFIHGIGSCKHTWNGVISILRNNNKCISYDLRGHGDSKPDESDFTLNDLVLDLEKLRSHLSIHKVHLVGHSLGGMIGPAYAKKFPDRVMSVSLLSTAAFRTPDDQKKILKIIKNIKEQGIKMILPNLISRWFTEKFVIENQDTINRRMNQVYETKINTFINVFNIYAKTEMGSWLKQIKVPCLVMTGEHDQGCSPKINSKIANAIPNAKLEILSNLKHTITIEAPNLVGSKIGEFLRRIS